MLPSQIKPRPNQRLYIQVLRRLSAEQRLLKAFELSEFAKALFRQGLRRRYPEAGGEELKAAYLKRLEKCHNRNY